MAQHDYVIANGSGSAVRSDLNNALAAIVSHNSGTSEPTTTYAYMPWADTSAGVMKLRNGANNAWITLYQLDGEYTTIPLENGTAAAPSLYFKTSGTDTGLYSPGTDQVAIATAGTGRLFVDASGNVGIGASSPQKELQITAVTPTIRLEESGASAKRLELSINSASEALISAPQSSSHLLFATSGNERARIDSSGRLLVGASTAFDTSILATVYGAGIEGNGQFAGIAVKTNKNSGESAYLVLGKSRGATGNSKTIVQSGDGLGFISFEGADGANMLQAATIVAQVDGTPGANDMPGRLVFSTTADGASTPTERMRIASNGALGLAGANYGSSGQALTSNGSGSAPTWQSIPAPAALSTASGSAPSYSARAWVNFDGTGTVTIRASGNVSSITDNGTGDYTVNFTTAMADTNYAVCTDCQLQLSVANFSESSQSFSYATGSVRVACGYYLEAGSNNYRDQAYVHVAIFR